MPKALATRQATDADQLVRRLQLDANGIAANARALMELELGSDAATFLSNLAGERKLSARSEQPQLMRSIDMFGAAIQGRRRASRMHAPGQASRGQHRRRFAEKLRRRCAAGSSRASTIEQRESAGARRQRRLAYRTLRRAGSGVAAHSQSSWRTNLFELRREICERLAELDGVRRRREACGNALLTYFCLRLDQLAILAAEHVVQLAAVRCKATGG